MTSGRSTKTDALFFKKELEATLCLCESINTPRALTVYLLLSSGEFAQYLALSIDWRHYSHHGKFADDYLVTTILQKNPRIPTDTPRTAVAYDKFVESERRCAETNSFISLVEGGQICPPNRRTARAIHFAREIIRDCLPRASLQRALGSGRFGPGATTSLSGVVTQGKKFSRRLIDVTPRLLDFRTFSFPHLWRETCDLVRLVTSSKLRFVPKNAKTDRAICIEPDLNIYVQLGTGALLRDGLANLGIYLDRQELNNQRLASVAWKAGLVTLDLSSASDTISRGVVWHLLPEGWCDLLLLSRVDKTSYEGTEISLSKWSSMGNGYTFELETLLFSGIILGAFKAHEMEPLDNWACYGDDMIFPEELDDTIRCALNFLGFSVNSEKTFGKGLFHESCGTDWFMGHNVRPFFLRNGTDENDLRETAWYTYANLARHWAHHRNGGDSCDSRLLPFWLRCFSNVVASRRYRIPKGFGDGGFHSNFDEARPRRTSHRKYGWDGYDFNYLRIVPYSRVVSPLGMYFRAVKSGGTDFSLGRESLRGRYEKPIEAVGYSPEWPNLGPWT